MSSARFEMVIPVPGDIDEQNHVNNTVYLRWVQDIATAHWRAVASPNAQKCIGWVVLRHEIESKGVSPLGDELVVSSGGWQAAWLKFKRFPEIRRNRDGRLL